MENFEFGGKNIYTLNHFFFRDDLTENVRKYLLVGIMSKIVLKNMFLFISSDINFYDWLLSLLKRFKAIRTNSFE